jgi:RimJ/RimL family protein N-acetyltransferase
MAVPALEFNTARLAFRAWHDRHRAPFAAMNADPEVMRYFSGTLTADQTNAGVDIWIQQFAERGWSNWAVELLETGEFIGFIGLSAPRRLLPFSPCIEIGWRLKRMAWGRGYATEGATECLAVGFNELNLQEFVSFTSLTNLPSIAVMKRIGLKNAEADFEHPGLPQGHPLRPHCLYKVTRAQWRLGDVQAFTQPKRQLQVSRAPRLGPTGG